MSAVFVERSSFANMLHTASDLSFDTERKDQIPNVVRIPHNRPTPRTQQQGLGMVGKRRPDGHSMSSYVGSMSASGFFRRNSIARWVANVCVAPMRNSRYLAGLRVIRWLSRLGLGTGSRSPVISGLRLCQK